MSFVQSSSLSGKLHQQNTKTRQAISLIQLSLWHTRYQSSSQPTHMLHSTVVLRASSLFNWTNFTSRKNLLLFNSKKLKYVVVSHRGRCNKTIHESKRVSNSNVLETHTLNHLDGHSNASESNRRNYLSWLTSQPTNCNPTVKKRPRVVHARLKIGERHKYAVKVFGLDTLK